MTAPLIRPFTVRPFTDAELRKWFGGIQAVNHECAPCVRVIQKRPPPRFTRLRNLDPIFILAAIAGGVLAVGLFLTGRAW